MKKLILLSFIVISYSANAQWVQQNSGTINDLSTIFFPTANVGYIADNGSVLKTIDGGTNWNIVSVGTIYNGAPLYFTSVDTGYSSGTGGILKTVDGGLTWIDNFPYSSTGVQAIYFLTNNIGYAIGPNVAGDSLITFKTINAGNSWSLVSTIQSSPIASSLFFTNQSIGFMVMNNIGIYKTINGGITWLPKLTTIAAAFLNSIHFPSSTIGYAVGGDTLFKSIDAGETWLPQNNLNSTNYNTVFFINNTTGFAAGGNGLSTGAIIKTIDGGINWTLEFAAPFTGYCLQFPNDTIGYVCGSSGAIYKTNILTGMDDETKQDNTISIYPNPCTSQLEINNSGLVIKEVKIYNVVGEEILSFDKLRMTQNGSVTLDVSGFAKGIYFIEVTSASSVTGSAGILTNVVRKKFVKQ